MEEFRNPEDHINEEPRNDFMDTAIGFASMFIFILVVAIVFTAISLV